MELKKAIRKRRSIREFKDKKIKKEIINDIISNAKYSPSACNRQGWEVILTDSKIIETSIKSPCGLLIIYDNRTDNLEYQDHIQSASAFIQNILLLAYEKKIGTCWVCNLPPKKVLKKTFNLKKFQEPIAYIAMGYPKIIPKFLIKAAPSRKFFDAII